MSKSDERARQAQAWVEKEVAKLCDVIEEIGDHLSNGQVQVRFGDLFYAYQEISDTLVGIMLRAKKRNLIHYEGHNLFQGKDDEVIVTLLNGMPPPPSPPPAPSFMTRARTSVKNFFGRGTMRRSSRRSRGREEPRYDGGGYDDGYGASPGSFRTFEDNFSEYDEYTNYGESEFGRGGESYYGGTYYEPKRSSRRGGGGGGGGGGGVDLSPYQKMLKAGIPLGAVRQKMEREGVDPDLLDDSGGNSTVQRVASRAPTAKPMTTRPPPPKRVSNRSFMTFRSPKNRAPTLPMRRRDPPKQPNPPPPPRPSPQRRERSPSPDWGRSEYSPPPKPRGGLLNRVSAAFGIGRANQQTFRPRSNKNDPLKPLRRHNYTPLPSNFNFIPKAPSSSRGNGRRPKSPSMSSGSTDDSRERENRRRMEERRDRERRQEREREEEQRRYNRNDPGPRDSRYNRAAAVLDAREGGPARKPAANVPKFRGAFMNRESAKVLGRRRGVLSTAREFNQPKRKSIHAKGATLRPRKGINTMAKVFNRSPPNTGQPARGRESVKRLLGPGKVSGLLAQLSQLPGFSASQSSSSNEGTGSGPRSRNGSFNDGPSPSSGPVGAPIAKPLGGGGGGGGGGGEFGGSPVRREEDPFDFGPPSGMPPPPRNDPSPRGGNNDPFDFGPPGGMAMPPPPPSFGGGGPGSAFSGGGGPGSGFSGGGGGGPGSGFSGGGGGGPGSGFSGGGGPPPPRKPSEPFDFGPPGGMPPPGPGGPPPFGGGGPGGPPPPFGGGGPGGPPPPFGGGGPGGPPPFGGGGPPPFGGGGPPPFGGGGPPPFGGGGPPPFGGGGPGGPPPFGGGGPGGQFGGPPPFGGGPGGPGMFGPPVPFNGPPGGFDPFTGGGPPGGFR